MLSPSPHGHELRLPDRSALPPDQCLSPRFTFHENQESILIRSLSRPLHRRGAACTQMPLRSCLWTVGLRPFVVCAVGSLLHACSHTGGFVGAKLKAIQWPWAGLLGTCPFMQLCHHPRWRTYASASNQCVLRGPRGRSVLPGSTPPGSTSLAI